MKLLSKGINLVALFLLPLISFPPISSMRNPEEWKQVTTITSYYMRKTPEEMRQYYSSSNNRTPKIEDLTNLENTPKEKIKRNMNSAYRDCLQWMGENPRLATSGLLSSMLFYNLYNSKKDIEKNAKKQYRKARKTMRTKREELADLIQEQGVDLLEKYYDIKEDGLTKKDKAYIAGSVVGTGLGITGFLVFQDKIVSGLKSGSNMLASGYCSTKNACFAGIQEIDKVYSNHFTSACDWAKDNPSTTLVGAGALWATWLGFKAVRALNKSKEHIVNIQDFFDTITNTQWKKLSMQSKKVNTRALIAEAQDNPKVLQESKIFMSLLSEKQKKSLAQIIESQVEYEALEIY